MDAYQLGRPEIISGQVAPVWTGSEVAALRRHSIERIVILTGAGRYNLRLDTWTPISISPPRKGPERSIPTTLQLSVWTGADNDCVKRRVCQDPCTLRPCLRRRNMNWRPVRVSGAPSRNAGEYES